MRDATSFGRWVKQLRAGLGLTQELLAERVGCAPQTIRKIERGERRPSRQIAERLALALELAPEQRDAFTRAARGALKPDAIAGAAEPSGAPARTLPAGTVTFLFTDIEGSTRLWEQHPQAMAHALASHDALLYAAIAAHGGVVFRTVGDAFCAAFDSAPAALSAALASQRALHAEPWGATGPLRVRMALYTSTAEVREDDYVGEPFSRILRILEAAHGGQTLLALSTRDLGADHLPPGIALRDLGEHRLKDLSRPEQIFQLISPDLPNNFPPLRTLNRYATHQLLPPTPFIGRAAEQAELAARLADPACRLLTIVGPGGVGKTRLVLEAATNAITGFADGICFVPFAPVGSAELIIPAIAHALGFAFSGAAEPFAQLIRYVREKDLLLVLDNFEHLLEGTGLLADILQQAPQVKLLVTSRERLHLQWEWVIELRGLPSHPAGRDAGPAGSTAMALFVERARRIRGDFALEPHEDACVTQICQLLEGLPLGIELAAAWVRVLSCAEIAQEIARNLDFLAAAARDVSARHRSLRAVFDQSWNLLSNGERRVLRQVSVFRGNFSREAATQVAGATLPLLAALVDKSLLRRNAAGRYDMHELVRQYAEEHLRGSAEAQETHERHAAYFLALAEEAEPQLLGAGQEAWRSRLEDEHDNLRAALAWSRAAPEGAETELRLAGALAHFWELHSHFSEGRKWLEGALRRRGSVVPAVQAKALNAVGVLAEAQGAEAGAVALIEESLALRRELGDEQGSAESLLYLGRFARNRGDYARACRLEEESLALFRKHRIMWGVVWALMSLGDVALDQGDQARAAARFQETLARAQELGNRHAVAWAIRNLGLVAHTQGDQAAAAARYQESLTLFEEIGSAWGRAEVLCNQGWLAHMQGDDRRATAHYQESLALFRELEGKRLISACLEGLAGLAGAQRRPERAARLFGAAAALRESVGPPLPPVYRSYYEQDVAIARAGFAAERWAAAWAAGHALPLDQAIAEALRPKVFGIGD